MKLGIGAWQKIAKLNVLPGKTPAQLNLQCQRMMGQQSLRGSCVSHRLILLEFMGVRLDPENVWIENNKKEGVRKNGCLINTGSKKIIKFNQHFRQSK